jgi:hypothetical protein
MPVDLTGGLDPDRELMFAARPEDPEMRDSASFWVLDDRGEIGLPRIGIEALASDWDAHQIQVNVALADGRVFRLRDEGKAWPVAGPDGRPTVLGAGPLAFTCVRPFGSWTLSFDGQAVQTSSEALVAGDSEGPVVDLAFHVDATMAAPPWIQGTMLADADHSLKTSIVGDLMGGPRYEQLFRSAGSVRIDGVEQHFTGTGLRIRRQGVRRLEGFWGHCWQSALFPSGKGFGYIAYPPRPDGEPQYNEGYIFRGSGDLVPARVVEAPWLTRLHPVLGAQVPVVLETAEGIERIEGVTVVSTHHVQRGSVSAEDAAKTANWSFPPLQQAGVRYRWDGEEAIGMLERSNLPEFVAEGR